MTFSALLIAMAPPAGNSGQSPFGFTMMMFLFLAIMYVMMIRPQMRKEKERKAMLENMKKGDRVLLSGGIIGQIAQIEGKVVKVKVADNVRLDVVRGGISMILADDADPGDAAVN
jgi:preprotein translocase subunit YajC